MTGKQKTKITDQVKQEHACIKRDLKLIKDEINHPAADQPFNDWRLQFIWRLRDFKNHLLKHFDFEEEGGFMRDIIEEAPEVTGGVKFLENQHLTILTLLDEIVHLFKNLKGNDEIALSQIRVKVLKLTADISKHENDENELIQTVYYQEYGYPT